MSKDHDPNRAPRRLLVVTGPSGAGRTTAIRALEDLGGEAIDNLPQHLLASALEDASGDGILAVGIDARTRDFNPIALLSALDEVNAKGGVMAELLYLDCEEGALLRRYSETRRKHPLAAEGSPVDGIRRELALMEPLRDRADYLIDTTGLTVHDLRAQIDRLFAPGQGRFMSVQLQSFSFKRGLPAGQDMVLDVRFLRNPHWVPDLRPLDGRDAAVAAHVAGDPLYAEFYDRVLGLIEMLLPAYKREGKSYLSIAIGCSGGRHRSVAMVEALSKALAEGGWQMSIQHRELSDPPASKPGAA